MPDSPTSERPDLPERAAFVTLVTNSDFGRGAVALTRSLAAVGARYPLIAMVPARARALDILDELARAGAEIRIVEPPPLSAAFQARHARDAQHATAPFTKGTKPDFHDPLDNFTKLAAWQQTDFDKLVFLDADTLAVKNIDRLAAYPELCAAPNLYESLADMHRMNSGVLTLRPDGTTHAAMCAALDRPGLFWRRTDQTFLEHYWPDWHGLPWVYNTLQYVYFNLPALWAPGSIRLIHYQYEKPWQDPHPKRDRLGPLIDLWRHVHDRGEIPELPPARDAAAPEIQSP